jgi:hypothetical protein
LQEIGKKLPALPIHRKPSEGGERLDKPSDPNDVRHNPQQHPQTAAIIQKTTFLVYYQTTI